MKHIIFCCLLVLVSVPATSQQEKPDQDLVVLAAWMEGAFSSEQQSKADTTYFDIRLWMKRIWKDQTDGFWILVEQAMSTSMDKPYRQRVYHVKRVEENMIESAVYTLKDPAAVIGAWNDSTKLVLLNTESIVKKRGCEVYMQMDGEEFFGGTHGTACSSELRGASYATSEVKIYDDRIMSWDRGFSADGAQVWGATKGGYIFIRQ